MKINEHDLYLNRGINSSRLKAILEYANQNIIDVGCGSGAYVRYLKDKFNIRGIDHEVFESWASDESLFDTGSILKLPYKDNTFETVLLFEVLEHINDPMHAIMELYRVTSKNIIITVPNCSITDGMKESGLIYNHWIDRTHVNFYSRDKLIELISSCGFKISHFEYINYINLGWLFSESIYMRRPFSKILSYILFFIQRKYPMTLLIVAEKV